MSGPDDASSAVCVHPTLDAMAAVYRLPREGGPESERFRAYLRLVREADGGGLQAYNPMAGAAALETVERLRADAGEEVAARGARDVLRRTGGAGAVDLAVVVASPGLWTHRLVTEAEGRLRAKRDEPAVVLMWAGEASTAGDVHRQAAAETARVLWNRVHGPPLEVIAALAREGVALAIAETELESLSLAEARAVRDAVAVLGESRARQDVLALAYGDPIAETLGLTAYGLPDRAGCRWAAACAARRMAERGAREALREAPRSLLAAV